MLASILHEPGWLLDNGVGQNLTAGVVVFALGWVWSRTKFWPLHAIHSKLDTLHASHQELHRKLDEHAKTHAEHARKIEAILSGDEYGAMPGSRHATPKSPPPE